MYEKFCMIHTHIPALGIVISIKCCLVFVGEICARLLSQSISSNRRIRDRQTKIKPKKMEGENYF